MEPSKTARIRDFVLAATILIVVGLFFLMAAIKAGIIGHYPSSFTQADQGDTGADDNVSPKQVEIYVAVYRAMQHDHSLTVEQACNRQGLTVSAFRDIEEKVEHDDQLHQRVLSELQPKAHPTTGAKSTTP